MDNELKELSQRVTKLEEWKILVDIARAREERDKEYIKDQFDSLKKSLDEFKGRIDTFSTRMLWAILTPIIGGLVVFALSGGFKLP